MDMKELLKALKALGNVEQTGAREVTITDPDETGFSKWRNVAKVRMNKGGLEINPFKGYMYKPGEYTEVRDVSDAIERIRKARKEARGKDAQGPEQIQA